MLENILELLFLYFQDESSSESEEQMVMEDMNSETSTALVQNDVHDPDYIKNKGCKSIFLIRK